MNICNLTEAGIGNPSLSVCLIMIYLRKAKTKFLCAAYSYSSSQTPVLPTGKDWLPRSFIMTGGLKRKMSSGTNSSVYILQVPDILNI